MMVCFNEQVWRSESAPNKACTGRVGLAAFSGSFLASSWFRQNGVISSHPPAGNASRWHAANNHPAFDILPDKDSLTANER